MADPPFAWLQSVPDDVLGTLIGALIEASYQNSKGYGRDDGLEALKAATMGECERRGIDPYQ